MPLSKAALFKFDESIREMWNRCIELAQEKINKAWSISQEELSSLQDFRKEKIVVKLADTFEFFETNKLLDDA